MKNFLIIVWILATFLDTRVDGVSYTYSSIECIDVNKEIFDTGRCSVDGPIATVITTLKKSLHKINVLVGLYKHEQNEYRQIFKLSRIEWCSFMAGSSTKSNYMINFIINTVKESTGDQLFHRCPFQGRIAMMNLTMKNDKLFSIYPRGQYRLRVNLSDGNNKEMFQVAFEIDLTE